MGVPGRIHALAQTTDGFLWLGTADGLFRFDGVRFEHYESQPGQAFPETDITALLATLDGGLWIGYRAGTVSFFKNGNVFNYGERAGLPPSGVRQFLRDSHGRIWAVGAVGLTRFDGSRWEKLTSDQNVHGDGYSVFMDRSGTIWQVQKMVFFFFRREQTNFRWLLIAGLTDLVWLSPRTGPYG